MYRTPQKFGIKAIKKEVLYCLSEMADTTSFVSRPISPNQVIFIGSFVCQISYDTLTPLLINAAYIDLTVKIPEAFKPHTNTSLSYDKLTYCKEATIRFQFDKFASTRFLRKEMFSKGELITVAIESCFLLTILNSAGNLSLRGLLLSQVSIQNLVCDPSFTLKCPNFMKESLTFIRLF
jgi:hypothetical protein